MSLYRVGVTVYVVGGWGPPYRNFTFIPLYNPARLRAPRSEATPYLYLEILFLSFYLLFILSNWRCYNYL